MTVSCFILLSFFINKIKKLMIKKKRKTRTVFDDCTQCVCYNSFDSLLMHVNDNTGEFVLKELSIK